MGDIGGKRVCEGLDEAGLGDEDVDASARLTPADMYTVPRNYWCDCCCNLRGTNACSNALVRESIIMCRLFVHALQRPRNLRGLAEDVGRRDALVRGSNTEFPVPGRLT